MDYRLDIQPKKWKKQRQEIAGEQRKESYVWQKNIKNHVRKQPRGQYCITRPYFYHY